MKVQYDFDQGIMNQNFPKIVIPTLMSYSDTLQSSRNTMPLLLDIQKIMNQQKSRQQKRIYQLKQKQQHISQHVGRCLAQKQRKIRQLQQKQKIKMYQQCTFKPKVQSKTQKRTFNQFLNQQKQFIQRINQKKNNLKTNIENQRNKNTFHPKINNPKRKTHDDNKTKDTVFERLYALKDKQNTQNSNLQQSQEQFQPKITQKSKKLARNMPVDDLLYNDALRRQQKSKDIQIFNNNPIQYKSQKPNLNNQKYVAQKFIKEYFSVIQKLQVPSSTSAKIEYVMFNQILKEMGFVGVQEQGQSNKQRSLIHEAYQLIQKYQVNAKNVCVFLLAIIGVYHINPINFQEGDIVQPDKDFAVDQPDGRKIQKYFDLFKRNRLFGESMRRQYEKQMAEPQEHSYHPKINKLSSELAQKYRDQMLEEANRLLQCYPQIQFVIPEDGMINHTDLLVLNNLANQIKRQNKKQQLDRKQMDSCTFKPITSPNSVTQTMFNSKMSNRQIASMGQKKSLELYNFHKNLQHKKESLMASRQYQDQMMKECTFAPKINNKKIENYMKNYQTKQIDEAIYRMKKGRDMAQQKKRYLQRGQKNSKHDKQMMSKNKQKAGKSIETQQTPTLLLDVNLGESIDRIVIYPGDQNRLQQLARQFAQKHGLDVQNQQKLCQLLRIQLENVLLKIEQDQQIQNQVQQ